jgi:hypothetical protein
MTRASELPAQVGSIAIHAAANNVLEGQLIGEWLIKQVDGYGCR